MHAEAISHPFHQTCQSHYSFETLVGQSHVYQNLIEQARLVAQADCRVLLIGEKGSGKETLARTIHNSSRHHEFPFFKIDCAEFRSDTLATSLQLWNRGEGPSSCIKENSPLNYARGSTLYLHNLEALTPEAQTWLLRCLLTIETNSLNQSIYGQDNRFRVIAGATAKLQQEVAAKRFRAELFYRLNVVSLTIPPLRHRLEDIEALACHFVNTYAGKYGKAIDQISEKTIDVLNAYHWPGNVQEMENLIEQSIICSKSPIFHIEQIVQGLNDSSLPF